jgi:hypothetical protein
VLAYPRREDTAKDAATLEEMKVRVRGVSGGNQGEQTFAEQLAQEIATKYPAITQAKRSTHTWSFAPTR